MDRDRGRRYIVVGVDGSAASLAALRWADREADLREAGLRVVCAWESPAGCRAPYASRNRLPDWESERRAAGARLNEAAAELGPGAAVSVEVAQGLPARVLLDRAVGADMLVLGTKAVPGAETVGAVAQACLRHAPCPVVVVSAERVRVPVPA